MNNHKLANKNVWYVFISVVLSLSIYLGINSVIAATNPGNINNNPNTLNGTTTDAIAVRIVANPAQYSIDEWYAKQKFTGSPQKIKVDGYDAVRDNRTVYVAATNIKGSCQSESQGGSEAVPGSGLACSNDRDCGGGAERCVLSRIYFNIYIITYNQDATVQTSDVFGKILSNWKFNNNLNDDLGDCSFPRRNCGSVNDCGDAKDYTCSHALGCVSTHKCLSDADCSEALCNSPKASLLRDVKRLESLNKVNQALSSYKNVHNKYPILAAGTFLPQVAISTWPSWQNSFVSQLGVAGSFDPVNKLGLCNTSISATTTMPGFDSTTCWNGTTKKYYNGSNSINLELPAHSYAMAYTTDINGSTYKLCANMETNYNFMSYNEGMVNLSAANCHTTAPSGYTGSGNNPPVIVALNLNGISGKEFNGYIKAEDPDGNPMTFSIKSDGTSGGGVGGTAETSWDSWAGGVPPVLQPTTDPKQKKLYSAQAGSAGNYNIDLMVTDSNGASVATTAVIRISAGAPIITASDVDYDLSSDTNYALNYNLYFDDLNFSYLDLSYNSSLASAFNNWLKNMVSLVLPPVLAQSDISVTSLDTAITPVDALGTGGPNISTKPPVTDESKTGDSTLGDTKDTGGNKDTGTSGLGDNITPPATSCVDVTGANENWRVAKTLTSCFNLNNGLKGRIYTEANGRYRLNIYGNVEAAAYSQDTNLNYKIKVYNSLGKNAEKGFTIKLKSNPPQLEFSCNKKAPLLQAYSCQINNLNPKNKVTTYSYSHSAVNGKTGKVSVGLPAGLSGSATTGLISGSPTVIGEYNIIIKAENEYGVISQKDFNLLVESSCGRDLVKYSGGPWNQSGDIKNQGGYYRTVLIGSQCWLGDNLNVPHFDNSLPEGNTQTSNHQPSHFSKLSVWWQKALALLFKPYFALAQVSDIGVCYNNDSTYCESEGRLYKAAELSDSVNTRGICPSGFHIPSKAEYDALLTYLGTNAADKLMTNGDSGFEGFLSGEAYHPTTTTNFLDRNSFGNFWSSTIQNVQHWYLRLARLNEVSSVSTDQEQHPNKYYSVRCLAGTGVAQTGIGGNPQTFTLAYTSGANGSVSGTLNQVVSYGGFGSAVTAVPSPGATFVKWSDDVTDNPRIDYNVTNNRAVTATFAPHVCGNPWLDTRDNQSYPTVQISTQCWMAKNLNIGTQINGSVNAADNGIIEKYCSNNLGANCDVYGGLYRWTEAMQYSNTEGTQGICPIGWHIPRDSELTTLTNYLGGLSVAGGKMKEAGVTHWLTPNTGATNSSGFTALPAGARNESGVMVNFNTWNSLWSSTLFKGNPLRRDLGWNTSEIASGADSALHGFSIRCLKN